MVDRGSFVSSLYNGLTDHGRGFCPAVGIVRLMICGAQRLVCLPLYNSCSDHGRGLCPAAGIVRLIISSVEARLYASV